jgi:hypothetical protein
LQTLLHVAMTATSVVLRRTRALVPVNVSSAFDNSNVSCLCTVTVAVPSRASMAACVTADEIRAGYPLTPVR